MEPAVYSVHKLVCGTPSNWDFTLKKCEKQFLYLEACLRDTVSSSPDHHNKANTIIK